MPFPDWMSQHGLRFPIASEHFGPARLHITPTGYEKDTNGNFAPAHRDRVYGLYVTARFDDDGRGLKYEIHDFVQPECFHELEMLVAEPSNQAPPVLLQGDDGYLEIRFQREADGKLRIICTSPSRGWSVDCLRLQLECTVNAESLAEPRKQIGELLELVGKIDSGSIGA